MANQNGILGFFSSPEALLAAARGVKEAGFKEFEVFSPFPIHGMDEAQGLERSNVPFITLAGGLTGACCGFLLQFITSVIAWPINVGGKPFNSWPAFIPITFELTILFAGIANLLAMLGLNRLPNLTKASLDPDLTCSKFAVWIYETSASPVSIEKAHNLLKELGATQIQSLAEKGWF
jgi:hypothetical protein